MAYPKFRRIRRAISWTRRVCFSFILLYFICLFFFGLPFVPFKQFFDRCFSSQPTSLSLSTSLSHTTQRGQKHSTSINQARNNFCIEVRVFPHSVLISEAVILVLLYSVCLLYFALPWLVGSDLYSRFFFFRGGVICMD